MTAASPEELEALARLAYEANRESMSRAVFRAWDQLHAAEQKAWRASVRAVLFAVQTTKP